MAQAVHEGVARRTAAFSIESRVSIGTSGDVCEEACAVCAAWAAARSDSTRFLECVSLHLRGQVIERVLLRYKKLALCDVEEAFQGLLLRFLRDGTVGEKYESLHHCENAVCAAVAVGSHWVAQQRRQWRQTRGLGPVALFSDDEGGAAEHLPDRTVDAERAETVGGWADGVLSRLNSAQREAVELLILGGMSQIAAAEMLGMPKNARSGNTMKCRKIRALAKIRSILEKEYPGMGHPTERVGTKERSAGLSGARSRAA